MIEVAVARSVPGFSLDVAFRNDAGITALFGRSGSGKSMTLGLIAGLMDPDKGRVRIGDSVLLDTETGVRVPMHKRRVGLVFQDSHLFPHLSVRQNLLFGRWFAPKSDRTISLESVVETLGIGALLARRPAGLSGGERQRVAIGRALLACPRLLLFDEPLAALDRQRKLEILPLIEQLRDVFGIPIIYVSHALAEVVRLAAHVVVLEAGRVVAQGDPASALSSHGIVEEPRFGRTSVIDVTLGEIDESYGLTALQHPAGTLWLASVAGPKGRKARALVKATDVSLATGRTGPLSIRSALTGQILAIDDDGALAAVELALTGSGVLVALITRRAVADLQLEVGQTVTALIKSVALDEGTIATR